MRNADLRAPVGNLPAPDGRPYFGGAGNNSLNPSLAGGGIYVLDNTSDGHSINVTAQLRKNFASGLSTDRKSTRLNSSHGYISYAVFCLKKKKKKRYKRQTMHVQMQPRLS